MKKYLRIAVLSISTLSIVAIATFFILEYKAVEVPENECKIIEGKVVEISEGGIKDAVFKLDGNETIFYINRGLEKKYTLAELEQKILEKKVRIYFSNHKSILDRNNKVKHIRKLELENQTFYTEF